MRIHIAHETRYAYATPARSAIQILRLTPRNSEGQYVRRWRIDVDHDCRLRRAEDCFGNITHTFTTEGPLDGLVITVDGEVETTDMHGVAGGTTERFPPEIFLRETPLTAPDAAVREFAQGFAADGAGTLDRLHELTGALHARLAFDTARTDAATTAADAFALGRGVCQDHAHVFLAAARAIGIPARYVSGYFHRADGEIHQEAGHAWAEAHVPDLGWVGFDPANGISPTDQHVRVATGLDYLGAAPIRGSRHGGEEETLDVDVLVEDARGQFQN